jgi:2-iminobutanoate/2-iminopropanoate deaminase
MVEGGIVQETERVLDNLSAILAEAGLSFDHVVKTTIYLVDLGDFNAVNEAYGKRFARSLPARATVQVAALPRGAHVEIDAIAVTPVLP